jgi:crotonobetainyl-CoA:carnitine CoA-transferase CaiB-like acyl-CoA transferase
LPAEVRAEWERALDEFFRGRTKQEIASDGRRRGINAAVVQEPADVLGDPQLAARGFWASTELEGVQVRVPGQYVSVREGPIVAARSGEPPRGLDGGALAGVRVLDLSWALVGSLTTKALGDYGASVVKVESAGRPCLTRIDAQVARSTSKNLDDKPWFAHLNTSKHSLNLDLKHPRAREVLDPLIAWADVIVENFSPGTLQKLELDYDSLKQRRPDLIMVSASAYGQTGPLAQSWGVDGTSAAMSARTWLTGWEDRPPVTPGAVPYADVVVPQFMVAAIGAALLRKARTGRGCYVDVSMYEISVHQMTRALIAEQLGRPLARSGNRDRDVWHQGVYPARGVDRWIAVSWFDPDDYRRLIEMLGGEWPDASEMERAEVRDAFDRQFAARTRDRDDFEWMEKLQAAGIAAAVVQDIEDLCERDPQLRARPAWVTLDHALLGDFEHQSVPYHLARTPAKPGPAPKMGEHTQWVCCQLCGLSEEQLRSLIEANVVAGPRS